MSKPAYLLLCFLVFLFSCKKEGDKDRDMLEPEVTVTGTNPVTIDLNSQYTDAGATAYDKVDGNVQVTSDYSALNPNADSAGTYTIRYTAKDNAGNKGYGYRTVIVQNSSATFSGSYIVTSINGVDTTVYNQTVTGDSHINNRIHFSDFGNFSNNSHIYADFIGGTLTLPSQYVVNIGSDHGQPCDVVNHLFQSTSSSLDANGFTIDYTDNIVTPLTCQGNSTIRAIFVKQ